MRPNIEVSIDELVLHGFAPADRYRIGAAVERELARLLAQNLPSTFAQGAHIPRVDGGAIRVTPGAKVESIGSQIAQAVYGGMSRKS